MYNYSGRPHIHLRHCATQVIPVSSSTQGNNDLNDHNSGDRERSYQPPKNSKTTSDNPLQRQHVFPLSSSKNISLTHFDWSIVGLHSALFPIYMVRGLDESEMCACVGVCQSLVLVRGRVSVRLLPVAILLLLVVVATPTLWLAANVLVGECVRCVSVCCGGRICLRYRPYKCGEVR